MIDLVRKRYLAIIAVRYLRDHPYESVWYDEAECEDFDKAIKLAASYRMQYEALLKTVADGFVAPPSSKA